LRSLDRPHNGPDIEKNLLVVRPNHHADLDYGMLRIDPKTLVIQREYDDVINGRTLTVAEGHFLDREYLQYHSREAVCI
jgi:predicted restriction endonuclease